VATSALRTAGKTPTMAFVLDYLREFPGAEYGRVRKAALSHGLPAPPSIVYGNALRVLRTEADRAAHPEAPRPVVRRRRGVARGIEDLADVASQMEAIVADLDRLRSAVDQIRAVIRSVRPRPARG